VLSVGIERVHLVEQARRARGELRHALDTGHLRALAPAQHAVHPRAAADLQRRPRAPEQCREGGVNFVGGMLARHEGPETSTTARMGLR
jgi:hypothetical protein